MSYVPILQDNKLFVNSWSHTLLLLKYFLKYLSLEKSLSLDLARMYVLFVNGTTWHAFEHTYLLSTSHSAQLLYIVLLIYFMTITPPFVLDESS